MSRDAAGETIDRSRSGRLDDTSKSFVPKPLNRQRSMSVPPDSRMRPNLTATYTEREIERDIPPAPRRVDFYDDDSASKNPSQRERSRYEYADSGYHSVVSRNARFESERRGQQAAKVDIKNVSPAWERGEERPKRATTFEERWQNIADDENQRLGKQLSGPFRRNRSRKDTSAAAAVAAPLSMTQAPLEYNGPNRYERSRSRSLTSRSRSPSPFRVRIPPNLHLQAIWDESTKRDATVHFEIDAEEDIESMLEEFCRLKRFGLFKSAEEYFQIHLASRISTLPVAVEYAGMLLEQGAYKRLDELIQDGQLTFPSEPLIHEREAASISSERSIPRTEYWREREEKAEGLTELEAERRRRERIREQDEEIRRRPAVPTPLHSTATQILERNEERKETFPARENTTSREVRSPPGNRNVLLEEIVINRRPEPRSNKEVYNEDSIKEGLTVDLLRANLRLIVASANMYSHGDFKQMLREIRENRSMLSLLGTLDDEKLDTLWVQAIHHMIKAISYIEKGSNFASNTVIAHLFTDWTILYSDLVSQGRIWDFRDVLTALVSMFGASETWRKFFKRDLYSLDSLTKFMEDWALQEYDESTHLAVLDILVFLARAVTLELRRSWAKNVIAAVQRILEHARSFAVAISENNPEAIKSKQYIRWILAEEAFAKQMAFIDMNKQEPNCEFLTRFPGLTIWTGILPIYIPINEENPGWHSSDIPGKSVELLKIALSAAEDIGDYRTQAMCLGELICHSKEPHGLISQLATLQKDVMDDKVGYLETCLSKYLLLTDEKSTQKLRDELSEFDARQTASYVVLDPLVLWCERKIQQSLYRSSGRFHIEAERVEALAERQVENLPRSIKNLLVKLNMLTTSRIIIENTRAPLPPAEGERSKAADIELEKVKAELATLKLERKLEDTALRLEKEIKEKLRLKEELAATRRATQTEGATPPPARYPPKSPYNGNQLSNLRKDISINPGTDDLQTRSTSVGEHQVNRSAQSTAYYSPTQTAWPPQRLLLTDRAHSFSTTRSDDRGFVTAEIEGSTTAQPKAQEVVIENEIPRRVDSGLASEKESPNSEGSVIDVEDDTGPVTIPDDQVKPRLQPVEGPLDKWVIKLKTSTHERNTESREEAVRRRARDALRDPDQLNGGTVELAEKDDDDDDEWGDWGSRKKKTAKVPTVPIADDKDGRGELGARIKIEKKKKTPKTPTTSSPAGDYDAAHSSHPIAGEEGNKAVDESPQAIESTDHHDEGLLVEDDSSNVAAWNRAFGTSTNLNSKPDNEAPKYADGDDVWGFGSTKKIKKKKKTISDSTIIEGSTAETEGSDFSATIKDNDKAKAESALQAEIVEEAGTEDPWGSFSTAKKGKKGKKGKSLAASTDITRSIDEVLLSTPPADAEPPAEEEEK